MAKTATKAPPTKAEWLKRVDAAVFKEAPSVGSTLRDGSVRDFAREFGVPEPVLSEAFWRNEHHLVGIYGPLGPDLRLRARFVGAETRWDDRPERFYDLTDAGVEQAARDIADLLRVGPSRLMNARENMRDAMHYVREMRHYDGVVAEHGSLLNGLNSAELLDMYRRAFRNAISSLKNAANQLLETPQHADAPSLADVKAAIAELTLADRESLRGWVMTHLDVRGRFLRRPGEHWGGSFYAGSMESVRAANEYIAAVEERDIADGMAVHFMDREGRFYERAAEGTWEIVKTGSIWVRVRQVVCSRHRRTWT
jgi:hypothetical protein